MQLSNERLERNKEAARAFYDLMFNECKPGGGDRTLRRRDVHPAQPRGRRRQAAFIDYLVRMAREYPGKRVEFKRA
jgi:predicted SnoaL-like aldol condensation-catalyzing enzyme